MRKVLAVMFGLALVLVFSAFAKGDDGVCIGCQQQFVIQASAKQKPAPPPIQVQTAAVDSGCGTSARFGRVQAAVGYFQEHKPVRTVLFAPVRFLRGRFGGSCGG